MWEIWVRQHDFPIEIPKGPVAWFKTEELARQYLDFLIESGFDATALYNDYCAVEYYDCPNEWFLSI